MFIGEIATFVIVGLLVFMGLSYIVKHYIRKKSKKHKV